VEAPLKERLIVANNVIKAAGKRLTQKDKTIKLLHRQKEAIRDGKHYYADQADKARAERDAALAKVNRLEAERDEWKECADEMERDRKEADVLFLSTRKKLTEKDKRIKELEAEVKHYERLMLPELYCNGEENAEKLYKTTMKE